MTLAFTLMGNEIALLPKRAKNRDSEGMEIQALLLAMLLLLLLSVLFSLSHTTIENQKNHNNGEEKQH